MANIQKNQKILHQAAHRTILFGRIYKIVICFDVIPPLRAKGKAAAAIEKNQSQSKHKRETQKRNTKEEAYIFNTYKPTSITKV